MNSVLQCLSHTPPLAQLLLAGRDLSARNGGAGGGVGPGQFDPVAATQQLVRRVFSSSAPHKPNAHAKGLRAVNKR
jgi:hypothetical protein